MEAAASRSRGGPTPPAPDTSLGPPAAIKSLTKLPPLARFSVAMLVLFTIPPLCRRVRLPVVVGLLSAGVLIGPYGLQVAPKHGEVAQFFADLGKLLLMFFAGLEIDLIQFNRTRNRSVGFGLLTFGFPLAAGMLVGFVAGYQPVGTPTDRLAPRLPHPDRLPDRREARQAAQRGGEGHSWRRRLHRRRRAARAGRVQPGPHLRVRPGCVRHPVARTRRLRPRGGPGAGVGQLEAVRPQAVERGSARTHAAAGGRRGRRRRGDPSGGIIGAFLAGLAVNAATRDSEAKRELEFIGNHLFIPVFSLTIGFLIDLKTFAATLVDQFWLVSGIVGGLIGSKFLAAKVARCIYGYTRTEGLTMWSLSLPQVAATLAAALVTYNTTNAAGERLVGEPVLNPVIVLLVVTSVLGPILTEQFARRLPAPAAPSEPKAPPLTIPAVEHHAVV